MKPVKPVKTDAVHETCVRAVAWSFRAAVEPAPGRRAGARGLIGALASSPLRVGRRLPPARRRTTMYACSRRVI